MRMADSMALEKGFTAEIAQILSANENGIREFFEREISDDNAIELGRNAARYAFAPIVWRAVAGDVLTTTQVTEFLDISRQAVAKRVRHRSLFAIDRKSVV